MGGLPYVFAEYNSFDKNGDILDLSHRKKTYSIDVNGVTVSQDAQNILTDSDVVRCSYENVVMGSDKWNPRSFFEKVNKPTNLAISGKTLSWNSVDYAISYVVLRNDSVIGFTKDLNFEVSSGVNGTNYSYKIKAVNEFGSLSEASDAVSGLYTGTVQTQRSGVCVYFSYKKLMVNNLTVGSTVAVYNFNGMLLYKQIAKSTSVVVPVNTACVVRINSDMENLTLKVIK